MNSREAIKHDGKPAMFKKSGRIYKLLKYSENLHSTWKNASDLVPSPVVRINKGTYHYLDEKGRRHMDVLVIEMKQILTGHFFQMTKGGEGRLTGWINQEEDRVIVKRILGALQDAKAAKITDPQGFYLTEGMYPLVFIDIHTRSAENSELDTVIAKANQRLQELEEEPSAEVIRVLKRFNPRGNGKILEKSAKEPSRAELNRES